MTAHLNTQRLFFAAENGRHLVWFGSETVVSQDVCFLWTRVTSVPARCFFIPAVSLITVVITNSKVLHNKGYVVVKISL